MKPFLLVAVLAIGVSFGYFMSRPARREKESARMLEIHNLAVTALAFQRPDRVVAESLVEGFWGFAGYEIADARLKKEAAASIHAYYQLSGIKPNLDIIAQFPRPEEALLRTRLDQFEFTFSSLKKGNQAPQHNAGSRPSSDDTSASETSSSRGPRGSYEDDIVKCEADGHR